MTQRAVKGERSREQGVTLVELSVVLIIIGLLMGGVVAAKNLIRAAELRQVMVELDGYKGAIKVFRDRYRALPGDMQDATRVWGAYPYCNLSAGTPAAEGVCNGNGDGRVGQLNWTSAYPSCSRSAQSVQSQVEAYQFWRHLQMAGLITGEYTGHVGSFLAWEAGVNTPDSQMGKGFTWTPMDAYNCDQRVWDEGGQGQALRFGAADSANIASASETFQPEEAYSIDSKVDDGFPGMGNVRAVYSDLTPWGTATRCAEIGNRSAYATLEYNVNPASGTVAKCALYFPNSISGN